jgi:hypothetical protein
MLDVSNTDMLKIIENILLLIKERGLFTISPLVDLHIYDIRYILLRLFCKLRNCRVIYTDHN